MLPTIADALDIRLPFEVDGRPLLDAGPPATQLETFSTANRSVRMDVADFEAQRRRAQADNRALFGTGRDSLYRIGPAPSLLGRRPGELQVGRSRLRAEVESPELLERFDPRSALVPTLVAARVDGGSVEGRAIAIALNERIAATSVGFKDLGEHDLNISALVPESALRPGRNRLDLFEVRDPSAPTPTLLRLGGTPR